MIVDSDALAASLRRLTGRDDGGGSLHATLGEVVAACVDIFGVTGGGVMLADESGSLRYVAASDGQGRLLEKAEGRTRQGPCTDAFELDEMVGTDDLRTDRRWPALRSVVAEQPELRAVLGVPVRLGTVPVGTLDVFLDHPHVWEDSEREALVRFGDVVQATLTASLAAHTAGEQATQLQHALDHRVVIERGIGYLMAAEGLGSGDAFEQLRGTARRSRTKIGVVAQHLLDTGRLPTG